MSRNISIQTGTGNVGPNVYVANNNNRGHQSLGPGRVMIGGRVFSASENVQVSRDSGVVFVDGEPVSPADSVVRIEIAGDVPGDVWCRNGTVSCHSIGGDVKLTSGKVSCGGDITGSVYMTNGSVKSSGNVSVAMGSIQHRG